VHTVNCAQYQAADPKIVQGELFGIKKGAAKGITKDEPGIFHRAKKGLLIMEEIGELPPNIQAQLLTFIEEGYFYRVGKTEHEKENVTILGSTNRQEALKGDFDTSLRKDFFYRFSQFTIAPLYERRRDILYYMLHIDSEFVLSLTKPEIFLLLSYNWEGNVREIEQVLIDLEVYRLLYNSSYKDLPYNRLERINKKFKINRLKSVYDDLKKNGIKVDLIREETSRYGIDFFGNERPFAQSNEKRVPTSKPEILPDLCISSFMAGHLPHDKSNNVYKFKSKIKIKTFIPATLFEKFFKGLELYCALFHIPVDSSSDLLDLKNAPLDYSLDKVEILTDGNKKMIDISKNIFDYRSRLKEGPKESLEETAIKYIIELSEEELLDLYYKQLSKEEKKNMAAVARRAGIGEGAIRTRFKKHINKL
jgi:hypothetical protein